MVFALTGHDGPEIETAWFVRFTFTQVPFANHGSLISSSAEMLRDIRHMLVDFAIQGHDAVHMIVSACEDSCARWGTDRVGYIAVVEFHTLVRYAIQVGGTVDTSTVTADGLGCMVIGHNEHNIGSFRHVSELLVDEAFQKQ